MNYTGSCHCNRIAFEVDGELQQVMECNCSHCSRKGYLLWFVPRENFRLATPATDLDTYTFNKHVIQHHFCANCGCAPFGFGQGPAFNGGGTFAAGQLDRRTYERVGNALAAAPGPYEEAGQEPHGLILIGCTISHDLASWSGGGNIPRSWAAGAPADRVSSL